VITLLYGGFIPGFKQSWDVVFNFIRTSVNINYNNVVKGLVEDKFFFNQYEAKYFTNKKCGEY
jgi:hypothetical protein